MKSFLWISLFFCASALAQDVPVSPDLLGTPAPTTTPSDYEYAEETTLDPEENTEDYTYDDSTTEASTDLEEETPPDCLIDSRGIPIPDPNKKCTVVTPSCPPGFVLSEKGCVPVVIRTTPAPPPPQPLPVPPIVNETFVPPERDEIIQCPHGHIQNGNVCVPLNVGSCDEGHTWSNGHCVIKIKTCPPNFILNAFGNCEQKILCPANHVLKNGRCIQPPPDCPLGYRWDGERCEVAIVSCPPGSVLQGFDCVEEKISCPPGFELQGNECHKPVVCPPGFVLKSSGFCSRITETCPPGSVLVGNECQKTIETCPPGYVRIGGSCYMETPVITTPKPLICPPGYYLINGKCRLRPTAPAITPAPPKNKVTCPPGYQLYRNLCYKCEDKQDAPTDGQDRPTEDRPTPPESPVAIPKYKCPSGFILWNDFCYRCPPGLRFFEGKCLKESTTVVNDGKTSGNVNVNVDVNIPPGFGSSGGKQNILNVIEPVQNNITNLNKIDHPITLNNVNVNNINIYSDVQCSDGSIKTVIVKNNETINGCVEVNSTDSSTVVDKHETSSKCCEIVTPRRCQRRNENQWMCSHRRHNYCGNFCIANRLYLKPSATTFHNQVLTIAPSQPEENMRPCFGRGCQGFDCSGCMDGSFNCSPQCYTYPCNHAGCHYLSEDDFCSSVGGEMCQNR